MKSDISMPGSNQKSLSYMESIRKINLPLSIMRKIIKTYHVNHVKFYFGKNPCIDPLESALLTKIQSQILMK